MNRRVLVVDDDPTVQRAHGKMLERGNFQVTCASSGEQAVQLIVDALADGDPFAVMATDLEMAGWSGLETIRRAWAIDPRLEVLMCTGVDCTGEQLAEHVGVTDALLLIKKPVERVELVQAALALARKWHLSRQHERHVGELETMVRARVVDLERVNGQLAAELAWRDRIESELRVAHRLEAVGQLAAGIAHEINTPIQYVGDNLQFVQDSTLDLLRLAEGLLALVRQHAAPLIGPAEALARTCELDYLSAELPQATASIRHGVGRIATIVRAMKELSHPGGEANEADLVHALDSALDLTASTYLRHADVQRDITALPPVVCHAGEIGQVFLNIIVNATHAIEATGRRGVLGVRTVVDGGDVVISISDTGTGIPEAIRHRVFDAFFTTKEVGRGTGQGLSIARTIVVDRHGGALTFDTSSAGTTFHIRLPIAGIDRSVAA